MEKETIQVCARVTVGANGKFGFVLHTSKGRILFESEPQFDTVEEAQIYSSKFLSEIANQMRKRGRVAYRDTN